MLGALLGLRINVASRKVLTDVRRGLPKRGKIWSLGCANSTFTRTYVGYTGILKGYDAFMTFGDFGLSILSSFIGSVPALLLALRIDNWRLPALELIVSEDANSDKTFPDGTYRAGERWKFFRISVRNRPFSSPFRWIPRQAAENCQAIIEFTRVGRESSNIPMLGRWAGTPELPELKQDWNLRLDHPDPVTIPVDRTEQLDVITRYEKDREAYGWNNLAYLYEWRTPDYKLDRGEYKVKVTVTCQNGLAVSGLFRLTVGETIESTSLRAELTQ